MRKKRLIVALVAAVALPTVQYSYPANAAAASSSAVSTPRPAPATPNPAKLADPVKMLPGGWQKSSDEAVTVTGDATGLHVLAASESSGYAWKTVASLGDPSVETDLWIGQACVTGSGNTAVVVYAPEQATNEAAAQGVLGRAVVVDLHTGAVKDLGGGYSIAYFNPGCGTGDTAVLTEGGWAADNGSSTMSTGLALVNADTGTITSTVRLPGQITSAIPYQGQIAAAGGTGLEEISSSGMTHALAATTAVPYELTPDASGGLGYQTVVGDKVDLWHLAAGRTQQVASAAKGSVELRQTGGRVWLVGPDASKVHGLPSQWQPVDAPATAQPSTTGTLVVTNSGSLTPAKGKNAQPGTAEPVGVNVQLLSGSRQSASFQVATAAAPVLSTASSAKAAHPQVAPPPPVLSNTPVSADRTCAIATNDPSIQAYQPTFAQVEWAADQASQGTLNDTRPAGLYGSSLPSYQPQIGVNGLFPPTLAGVKIPPQVLLGVLTQESNLQQASTHDVQGQTSNPLTSFNWYGNWIDGDSVNTGLINWSNSDCGYGIGQITTGMCLAQGRNGNSQCTYASPLSATQQLAVAVDYQANIAASVQMLDNDWSQLTTDGIDLSVTYDPTYASGLVDSDFVDDWYDVLWDYNSGLQPGTVALGNTTGCAPGPSCTDGNGDWGLGYADNPMNSDYPPDRPTFGTASQSNYPAPGGATYSGNWDLSHPQYWPYQDKALAFAFDSVVLYDYSQAKDVQAFAFAHGNYTSPPMDLWCTTANHCSAANTNETVATGPDACQLTGADADHCWWHGATANWFIQSPSSTCSNCGLGQLTYAAGTPEPAAEPIAAQFAQTCASTLPSNAVIVGEGGKSALGCPGTNWTAQGSFSWNFAPDANGTYSSKILFDQIGGGFGGHFWFGYTVPNDATSVSSPNTLPANQNRQITGTWTPPSTVKGWTDIKIAIPGRSDETSSADYRVDPGGGTPGRNVLVDPDLTAGSNTWADLGDFYMGAGSHVSLSNVITSFDPSGNDIAWSAAAFIPVSSPETNYVAMGDSYASGDGLEPYLDAQCDRSAQGYPMLVQLPGTNTPISELSESAFSFIACGGRLSTGVASASINNGSSSAYNDQPQEVNQNLDGVTPWGYQQGNTPWVDTGGPVEGMQAENSSLSLNTALVTINIGGNDARFAPIMTSCAISAAGGNDCGASGYTLTQELNSSRSQVDLLPLAQFEPTVIAWLQAHLVQTYLAINAAAPNAMIIVAGYPQLFPTNPTTPCDSGSALGSLVDLSPDAQNMLNEFGHEVDTSISNAVGVAAADGVAIHYVDPTPEFIGHALCDTGTSWIQPLSVLVNQVGSFHPTATGQQQFADLINECLAGTLEC